MSRRVLSGVVVALLLLTTASGQQQTLQPISQLQTPTFRLQVEYVEVDVRVTDSKGNFVRDLTKDDFQVLEDGKPQTVAAFSLVDIPIEPSSQAVASSVSIESDVQSNERRFEGRVYAMVLDDANTWRDRTLQTKNAVRRFIEQHLGANDLMAIVFTKVGGVSQEFTSDKRLLLAAVDKFGSHEELTRTLPQPMGPGIGGVSAPTFTGVGGEGLDGKRLMRLLSKVAGWLDGITGRRKTVIFVSTGFVYTEEYLALDLLPTGQLGRTNVNIYAIDMRGPDVFQTATSQLKWLSESMGGFSLRDNHDIDRGFDRIVAENSSYYLLAYNPSHPRDGKVHGIDVRVKRPRVTVRARRGYAAPKGNRPTPRNAKTTSATVEALNSPIPLSDLGMRVFAAPFRGTPQPQVLLEIDLVGRDLPLEPGGAVEIAYLAVDAKGVEHGWRTDRLNLNLEAGMRTRAEQSGVRVLKRMQLPPGRYRLHVAAHDPVRRRSGSLIHDLHVPDLKKAAFALSGVALMSKSGAATVTAHADDEIKTMLPGPPTAARSFPQDDEIVAFAEVYDDHVHPHQVDIVTTVRSAAGAVVFEETEARESSARQSRQGGVYRHVARIPLVAFEPGDYVLSLAASSRLNANLAAERRVPFTVTATEPTR